VSKNGNLMLSVPVRGDGTIDSDEVKIVGEIGAWLKVNGEAIYATRPWKIFGEGPSTRSFEKGQFDGQRDANTKPFTPADIRFTQSKDGKTIYAIVLGWPTNGISLASLGKAAKLLDKPIQKIQLLGSRERIDWQQTDDKLLILQPKKQPSDTAIVFKITMNI
jgi:alpha-L-fucosidase